MALVCIVSIDQSLVSDSEVYWSKDGGGTVEERTQLQVCFPVCVIGQQCV